MNSPRQAGQLRIPSFLKSSVGRLCLVCWMTLIGMGTPAAEDVHRLALSSQLVVDQQDLAISEEDWHWLRQKREGAKRFQQPLRRMRKAVSQGVPGPKLKAKSARMSVRLER